MDFLRNHQCSKPDLFEFGVLHLGFVSDFDIRISDFSLHSSGSGYSGLGYIKDGLRGKSYKIPLTCSNHLGDNGSATGSRRGQWRLNLIDTHAHLDEIDDLEGALMRP